MTRVLSGLRCLVPMEAIINPSPFEAPLPLSRFELLHTTDPDQASQALTEAFCPHQLTPLDHGRQFDTRFHATGDGDVGLCYLDFGGCVWGSAREIEKVHVVGIPLAGHGELSRGRDRIQYGPGDASVPPVDQAITFQIGAGTPHLFVCIARDRMESHLRSMLDRPVTKPVRFDLGMDLTAPPARSWRKTVGLLLDEIDGDGQILDQPLVMREMERLILSQLLLAQPSNYSELIHGEQRRGTAPRAIRHASELIEGHAAEPLIVEDIAEAVGISVRALQEGFRRFLDTTPMAHLREIRLQHVREELTTADPASTTVTETALRWGFPHAGRFSARYRRRFGESPSATLRR